MNSDDQRQLYEQAMDAAVAYVNTDGKKHSAILVEQSIAAHAEWIWQQSERPSVIEMVATCIPSNLMSNDARWFIAEGQIAKLLTALLGPKEAADGNG